MKKLLFLVVLVGVGVYLYAETPVLDSFKHSVGLSEAASDDSELAGFPVQDEYGDIMDFGEVLQQYSDGIIVLHVCNADRQHCPRKDDIEHFEAVMELERNYPDEIALIGFNFSGTPRDIERYKSYYGVDYAMLTIPASIDAGSREDGLETVRNIKSFYKAISGENGRVLLPCTLFIKDGKYIVNSVSGLSSYDELEDALYEALPAEES